MAFSDQFLSYYRSYFSTEEEFLHFLSSLENGIPRTLRIRPWAESWVRRRLGDLWWKLESTFIPWVFSIARSLSFDPIERRIGFSLDHLVGNFYIQELAAATAVYILSDGKIHADNFQILDVAASPWGKTTQLAEYYPESFIIANEPSRTRIPQLLQNLDRMGSTNIGVTLYMGQFFAKFPESFDRVLLDAPCSGDGTMYKGTESWKYWHLKNIRSIAQLQKRLVESAYSTLKVWWEMVYSTCAMNTYEDEDIREYLRDLSWNSLDILYEKKFWPHIDHTWGFYILKIRKTRSHAKRKSHWSYQKTNSLIEPFHGSISPWKLREWYVLYRHKDKILVLKKTFDPKLLDSYYFMRFGDILGTFHSGKLIPHVWSYRYLEVDMVTHIEVPNEEILDVYLRGGEIASPWKDEYVLLVYQWIPFALEKRQSNSISNSYPKDWKRK